MSADIDPIVDNWYYHLDKGQKFLVVAIDADRQSVEIQHFDGDLEEVNINEWYEMDIAVSEAPENWSGPIDVTELDDYGTEITDTRPEDWTDPLKEFRKPGEELDGRYLERMADNLTVEYFENTETGLWDVEIYLHDVPEWKSMDYISLENAQKAAYEYYNQL